MIITTSQKRSQSGQPFLSSSHLPMSACDEAKLRIVEEADLTGGCWSDDGSRFWRWHFFHYWNPQNEKKKQHLSNADSKYTYSTISYCIKCVTSNRYCHLFCWKHVSFVQGTQCAVSVAAGVPQTAKPLSTSQMTRLLSSWQNKSTTRRLSNAFWVQKWYHENWRELGDHQFHSF